MRRSWQHGTALGSVVLGSMLGMSLASCAWDEGEPFATLSARIEARIDVPPGRGIDSDDGSGWQRLASNYQLMIERLEVEAVSIELLDAGENALGFDPARPPPGYTLCHNGHCHAEDGRLVAYEEIAAELGQGTGARAVVALPVGALDLASSTARDLACEPDCDLPLASITTARMTVLRIQAEGLVRTGDAERPLAGEVPWHLDLSFPQNDDGDDDPLIWSSTLDLPADRSHDPEVSLVVELALGSPLFDRVAWADLDASSGTYELANDMDARAAIAEALGELELITNVTR